MHLQNQIRIFLAAIVLMAGMIGFAQAQGRSEEAILLDEALKALRETKANASKVEAENQRLKEQAKSIGASLVEANRIANEFRDDYNKLLLETEALGIETLTKGERGVRERLLKAISDKRIVEEEREAMAHALLDLSDAIKVFMASAASANVEARVSLEAALKGAEKAIGIDRRQPAVMAKKTLDQGKVVSIHLDSGVLVLNLGEADGAQRGMPFEIIRKDRPVGTAMVVDVRDNICGALITKLIDDSDDAQVGDRVRVQTQKNL